ncbi:molybdopterin-guanine dinucleotide biosynthesis protein B [Oribacterium sp. WCC10]|uniref:molybdopterin-guanine dinucleotide biosynthesis protein B n=1 Tax=Oribacterium sp. WCC10 TaxID=1855343 RepID=UPI0008E69AE1|nr:molybdopterin-guanine dinucleotide biosynthesis protein B [Oribacterium sp. WCC10]SFG18845.1 molybdopterin-guanine dinucleotide biosynthesis protein MobB [Oribacterium sp. WCC10]
MKTVNQKQRICVISGIKNSGKTTLVQKLIKEFTGRGLKVAAIKHDGHDFSCDIPDTDSYRFTEAGAYGAAVFSAYRMFVHKIGCGENEEYLREIFPEADIILMEGFKASKYKKLEIIRKGISDCPASDPEGRFLIVTDHISCENRDMVHDETEPASECVNERETLDELKLRWRLTTEEILDMNDIRSIADSILMHT